MRNMNATDLQARSFTIGQSTIPRQGILKRFFCALSPTILLILGLNLAIAQGTWTTENIAQLATGSFCLSGLPAGSVTSGPESLSDDVTWIPTRIKIEARSKARLTLYDKPVDWAKLGPVNCSLPPPGHKIILSGELNPHSSLELKRQKGGQRTVITPMSLGIELGKVTLNPMPILGGTVSFENRLIWITNEESIDIRTGGSTVGNLVLKVTDIKLVNMKLAFGADAKPIPLTIGVTGKKVSFKYNLANANLSFLDGTLIAKKPNITASVASFSGLTFDSAKIFAVQFELNALKGVLDAKLVNPEISSVNVVHGPNPKIQANLKGKATASLISGIIEESETIAIFESAHISDLNMDTEDIKIFNSDGKILLSGAATINFLRIDDAEFSGKLRMRQANAPVIDPVLKDVLINSMEFDVNGQKNAPVISGNGTLSQFLLGIVKYHTGDTSEKNFQFGPANLTKSTSIPFSIKSTPAVGTIAVKDQAGDIAISGSVKEMTFKGAILIDSTEVRLVVPEKMAKLSINSAIAAKALIFDSVPVFSAADFRLVNDTPIEVSSADRSGTFLMQTSTMLIPDGKIHLDKGAFRLNVPMNSSAEITLRYNISNSQIEFLRGNLAAIGIDASAIDGQTLEINNIAASDGALHIDSFQIVGNEKDVNVQIDGFKITATKISHSGIPSFSGVLTQPFLLTSLKAGATQVDRRFQLSKMVATGVSWGARDLELKLADGFSAKGDAILSVDSFTEDEFENFNLAISNGFLNVSGASSGTANLSSLAFKASGKKSDLSGTASLAVKDINIDARFPMTLRPGCNFPLRSSIGLNELKISGAITKGIISGSVIVPEISASVREDGSFHCSFDQPAHIDVFWVIYPCGSLFSPKLCHPSFDFTIQWGIYIKYLSVEAKAKNTQARFAGTDGIKFCGGNMHDLKGPFIAAAYTPEFNRSIPGANELVNPMIATIAGSIETPLVNQFGILISFANIFVKPELLGKCQ